MNNQQLNERIELAINPIYKVAESWIKDQLDGTSLVKDSLDQLEKDKEESKQQLLQLIEDIGVEIIGELEPLPYLATNKSSTNESKRNILRIEQLFKLNSLMKGE